MQQISFHATDLDVAFGSVRFLHYLSASLTVDTRIIHHRIRCSSRMEEDVQKEVGGKCVRKIAKSDY